MLLFILFKNQILDADNLDTIEQEKIEMVIYKHKHLFIVSVALMNLL